MILTITGHIPGKKNSYGQGKTGRRPFKGRGLVRELNDIIRQIIRQTGNLEPIDHPTIKAHFICRDGRSDLDNKLTCLLDCMKSARLIVNDNLAHLHGPVTFSGEVGGPDERVIVEIG